MGKTAPSRAGLRKLMDFQEPSSGPGLGLAIADDSSDEEVRVVEGSTEGVGEDVAELTALVDRAWGGHAHVARHPTGGRESPEKPLHPRGVLRNIGVDFGVGAFEVHVRQDGRTAVTRTRQVDGVQVMHPDEAVDVDVDEAETRRGPPVPQEARLYVRRIQRLAQEGVGLQVDLAYCQVVCGLPVAMHPTEQIVREGTFNWRLLCSRCRVIALDRAGDACVETVLGAFLHSMLLPSM